MSDGTNAAFFDVDGTLVGTNIVHAFAYYAMNQGSILGTAWQTARTVLSVPLFWATDRLDRKAFNELFYGYYRGQSADRLETLADELFEDVLRPAIFRGTADLLQGARRAGCRIVFVTGALDFTVRHLADHLGADDLIANRMRFVNGVATGQVDPAHHRGRPQGAGDPRLLRAERLRPGGELRLLGLLLRLPHARGGGPPRRGEPGRAPRQGRARLRVARPHHQGGVAHALAAEPPALL